jgi:hypothetical protein
MQQGMRSPRVAVVTVAVVAEAKVPEAGPAAQA